MFDWIDVLYPRVRRHATLGYRSPAEFEAMTGARNPVSMKSRKDHITDLDIHITGGAGPRPDKIGWPFHRLC